MLGIHRHLDLVKWQHDNATSSQLLRDRGVRHGFFGKDRPAPSDVHSVRQVHGTAIAPAVAKATGKAAVERAAADGLCTTEAGVTIGVRTADCLPLLLVDARQTLALCVHAGWRGLTSGILSQAVHLAANHGVKPADLCAALGPSIGAAAFEVGPEVVQALYAPTAGISWVDAGIATSKGRDDRWHVDLQVAAAIALLRLGLQPAHINVLRVCTKSDPAWHSYRREGQGVGSNWAWITL